MSEPPLSAVPDPPQPPTVPTPRNRAAVDAEQAGASRRADDHVADLLRQIAHGDTAAFDAFYREFSSRVFGLCRRVLRDPSHAEEVAQEVFLEIWRRAGHFDATRGSATGWVMMLTHARAVDRVRSVQSAHERDVRHATVWVEPDTDVVVEAVEHRWERRAVRKCLGTLTQVQRESVTLAYYNGYTYQQVASVLQAPLPTVKTRMRDGLIRLRDCLQVDR